jgi:hypothetical protein
MIKFAHLKNPSNRQLVFPSKKYIVDNPPPSRGRKLSKIFKDSFDINNFKMIFDIFIFIYFFG